MDTSRVDPESPEAAVPWVEGWAAVGWAAADSVGARAVVGSVAETAGETVVEAREEAARVVDRAAAG
jgi:hypothetical protein